MRFHRQSSEVRLEMTPLIDVVFLLLTFFVFSLVLMVRADVLDIELPSLTAGTQAQPGDLITIVVDIEGQYFVNAEPVNLDQLATTVSKAKADLPDARILLAADVNSTLGDTLAAIDKLASAGITDFAFVGQPGETPPPATPATPEQKKAQEPQ